MLTLFSFFNQNDRSGVSIISPRSQTHFTFPSLYSTDCPPFQDSSLSKLNPSHRVAGGLLVASSASELESSTTWPRLLLFSTASSVLSSSPPPRPLSTTTASLKNGFFFHAFFIWSDEHPTCPTSTLHCFPNGDLLQESSGSKPLIKRFFSMMMSLLSTT